MPPWEKYQKEGPWEKYSATGPSAKDVSGKLTDVAGDIFNQLYPEAQYLPATVLGAERALLTNEPPQNLYQSVLRGAPAAIGGGIGGTAGLVAGIPLTAGAVGTSLAGSAAGGMAGESVRQAFAQGYSAVTGRGEMVGPGRVLKDVAFQGAVQIPGQIMSLGLSKIAQFYANRLPSTVRQFFGTPEPITEYVQKRGSQNVFTQENLQQGASLTNVGAATRDLATRRAEVGSSIGRAEDFILGSGGRNQPVNTSDIASNLRGTLQERGYTDPRTAELAFSADTSMLNKVANAFDTSAPTQLKTVTPGPLGVGEEIETIIKSGEPFNLKQAINAKRLIDENLEFGPTMNRAVSDPAAAILKNANNQLRSKVREQLGPGVGKLYDDFGVIADAQEKLAEFTGTKALSNVEQRAVQALKGIIQKNPAEVDNIVSVLGAGLPGGENQARQIFDSIAAEQYIKGGIGAPSSTLLKTITGLGVASGPIARGMIKASESLTRSAAEPRAYSLATGPVLSYFRDAYNNQKNKTPIKLAGQ